MAHAYALESSLAALTESQVRFLATLSSLLNSAQGTRAVVQVALQQLSAQLEASASTLFLLSDDAKSLAFWALQGQDTNHLQNRTIPVTKGIVGWVIQNQKPVRVDDAASDPRFFGDIDASGSFTTRNLICVPLTIRGRNPIGAIEVLNKTGLEPFTERDVAFVEQFGHQTALALDNARLYEEIQKRYDELLLVSQQKERLIIELTQKVESKNTLLREVGEQLGQIAQKVSSSGEPLSSLLLTQSAKRSLQSALYAAAWEITAAQERTSKEAKRS